jgi:hypothetical protein
MRIHADNMATRNARKDRMDATARHQFGFINGTLNGLHRRFQG